MLKKSNLIQKLYKNLLLNSFNLNFNQKRKSLSNKMIQIAKMRKQFQKLNNQPTKKLIKKLSRKNKKINHLWTTLSLSLLPKLLPQERITLKIFSFQIKWSTILNEDQRNVSMQDSLNLNLMIKIALKSKDLILMIRSKHHDTLQLNMRVQCW